MARLLPWVVVAAVLSGVTVNVLRLRGDVSLAGPSVAGQVLEVTAGVALIVVGGGVAGPGRQRWLLAAAGAAWLGAEWASPAALDATTLTIGLIVVLATLPLVLASRVRNGQLQTRPEAAMLGLALLLASAAAVLSGPLAAAAASPRDAGCTGCASDLIAVARNLTLNLNLSRLGEQLSIAAGVAAAAWLAARIARAHPHPPRPAPADLVADAASAAFALAVAAGAGATLLLGPADPADYAWHAAACSMLGVLAAAVAWPAARAARARREVAATLARAADRHGRAVDAISIALDDPGLRIAYPALDGAWRDQDGQLVTLSEENVTVVTDAGQTLAALIHGGSARVDQASVTGAVSAARLLLDSERLEAGALARLSDLLAARQLVIEASDAARTSLERDLHDGVQQRLVALRYALGLASVHAVRLSEPDVSAMLADADRAAEQALADLRELAHGISPGVLAAGGLGDAVRTAAEQSLSPVTITELPAERLPISVEHVAYRFIADCISHADGGWAAAMSIAVRISAPNIVVEIESETDAARAVWPPAHLSDRVAAAGGQLQRTTADGRDRLVAVLPCE